MPAARLVTIWHETAGPRSPLGLGFTFEMANWTIRRAGGRDADALAACLDAAYAPYAARIADLPPVSADCAGEIARFRVWVAEVADGIVGGLVLVPQDGFMLLANVAVLSGGIMLSVEKSP